MPVNAASALPAPAYGTQDPEREYRLGPLDTVDIRVYQVPDLSGAFQVGTDGTLTLPLVGTVRANGRTAPELQKDVTARLQASYLQSPQVTVTISGFNSQQVTIDGAVEKPGVFPLTGRETLLDAIALAGGLPRSADPGNVAIFRSVDGRQKIAHYDLAAIRNGKATDPRLYGGDVIVVPTSAIRGIFDDIRSATPAANSAISVVK